MSRDVPQGLINLLGENTVFPFFAVSFHFDQSTVRLWTGAGNLNIDGFEYLGAGSLLSFSDIEEGTDMSVRSATIGLEGISGELISLALSTPYQGRTCEIIFGAISSYQEAGFMLTQDASKSFLLLENNSKIELEGNIFYSNVFTGYMDTMQINEATDNPTISVEVVNKLVDLERARVARYTSGHQKTKYPDDKGLDFVDDLQTQELVWGRSVDKFTKKENASGTNYTEATRG